MWGRMGGGFGSYGAGGAQAGGWPTGGWANGGFLGRLADRVAQARAARAGAMPANSGVVPPHLGGAMVPQMDGMRRDMREMPQGFARPDSGGGDMGPGWAQRFASREPMRRPMQTPPIYDKKDEEM